MKGQIISQLVRIISGQSALPSLDECMTVADQVHAGFDWPKGTVPQPDTHTVRMLRMAALLEVLGSWYESAADEPEWDGGPFQAFNRVQMSEEAIDLDILSSRILVFASDAERNVAQVALDHMDEHLSDLDPAHPKLPACTAVREALA